MEKPTPLLIHHRPATWTIGSMVLKAARAGEGIAGESEGVPDWRSV